MTGKPGRKDSYNDQAGEKLRAFIAVCLPQHIISDLSGLQKRLSGFGIKMKYTAPESIHLTLKFLGPVRISELEMISGTLEKTAADHSSMELSAAGLGVFPNVRQARVMWTGVAGQTIKLWALQQDVEKSMEAFGFPCETRGFSGHLTLGRFRGRPDPVKIADAISKFGDFKSEPFRVSSVEFFESKLTSGGPVYRVISSHGLIC
jgi:2'-5' RNA ligase